MREECCSAPPHPPENTALAQCCAIKAIRRLHRASLAITASHHHNHLTTYSWQISSSRMDNVKGGSSDARRTPSRCQPVLLQQLRCQTPPKIRFEPTWESRSDEYTGKIQLIQVKHYCDQGCNLPRFAGPRPEEHINK